ncbi:MAG: endonuclease/exonuclease/phosphatase family protein [Spirochaetaceae bacterium]
MSRFVRPAVLVLLAVGLVLSTGRRVLTEVRRTQGRTVTVATFNVQTLFDGEYDGGEFSEFNPYTSDWNDAAYGERLEILATHLRAFTPAGAPDILSLQEIEGPDVLADLCERVGRGMYPHRVCAPGESAMSVCIASRFPLNAAVVHGLDVWPGPDDPAVGSLRGMLEVAVHTPGGVVRVIAAHWKSAREGREATAHLRRLAARAAARATESILKADPAARVIVAGDLNEEISEDSTILGPGGDAALRVVRLGAAASKRDIAAEDPPILYSPWSEIEGGSYVFRGRATRIDHLLFSTGFFPDGFGRHAGLPGAGGETGADGESPGGEPSLDGEPSPGGGVPILGRRAGRGRTRERREALVYGSAHLVTDWAGEDGAPARYESYARRGVSDHFALYAVLHAP